MEFVSRWRLFACANENDFLIAPVPLFHAILFVSAFAFIAAVIADGL
jgi:hypothetical protein